MFKTIENAWKKSVNFVKKSGAKVVAIGAAVITGSSVLVQNANATAPASLAEALAVSIDSAIVWTAMSVMIGIVGGIAAYYIVKRVMGAR